MPIYIALPGLNSICESEPGTEDRIANYAEQPAAPADRSESALEAENMRLRAELERMRREQGNA